MIRSSLESKLYILSGTRFSHQPAARRLVTAPQIAGQPRPKFPGWLLVLGGLIVLALLAYRIWGAAFDWKRFVGTFRGIDWRWFSAAILLILLTNLGRAVRWEIMLRPAGRKVSVWKLNSDTAIGFAAVTLLGRVGEVVRPYLIAVRTGLPFSSQVAVWLLERMLDLLAVLLMFGFALVQIPARAPHLSPQIQRGLGAGGYVFAALGAMCLALFIVFRNFSGWARQRILSALTFLRQHQHRRAEHMLEAFSEGLECTRDTRLLTLLLASTAVEWAIIVGSLYAMLRAIPATARLRFADAVILHGFGAFGTLLQIPGIGGGVQVASVVAFTGIYGLPVEAASATAILAWATNFAVIVPLGLACAFHEGLNWSKLKLLSTKQILED